MKLMKRFLSIMMGGLVLFSGLMVFAADDDILDFIPSILSAATARDGRTLITSVPYTANSPGSYVLNSDLSLTTSQPAITVNADNVTIDLDGFVLSGSIQAGTDNDGIYCKGKRNIEIRNGTLANFGGAGVRVEADGSAESRAVRLIGIRAKSNNSYGAYLTGDASLVKNSTFVGNGGGPGLFVGDGALVVDCVVNYNNLGIQATTDCTIRSCEIYDNASIGIQMEQAVGGLIESNTISGNTAAAIDVGSGVIIRNNLVSGNNSSGTSIAAVMVEGYGNRIENNNVYKNGGHGLYVLGEYNTIENNLITENTEAGIALRASNNYYGNNRLGGNGTNISNGSGGNTDGGNNTIL